MPRLKKCEMSTLIIPLSNKKKWTLCDFMRLLEIFNYLVLVSCQNWPFFPYKSGVESLWTLKNDSDQKTWKICQKIFLTTLLYEICSLWHILQTLQKSIQFTSNGQKSKDYQQKLRFWWILRRFLRLSQQNLRIKAKKSCAKCRLFSISVSGKFVLPHRFVANLIEINFH